MRRALCVLGLSLLAAPLAVLPPAITAQQPARPAITGIAFFRDYTTHPEEAQKFYGPTMGFAQLTAQGEKNTWVFPVNESQWIEVLHDVPLPNADTRMAAVGFTTRNVAELERYLNAHGVPTAEPMHDNEFAVRDPEGNLVYFVESPYASATGEKHLVGIAKQVSETHPLASASSVRMIHAGFLVHSREKENTFWRDVLGFKPYWYGAAKDNGATDYVSLQVPDGTDWIEYMLNVPSPVSLHESGVVDHFSLGTTRMQEVLADLQRNGCGEDKMCTSIQAGRDGKIQLNLYDPDLTRVEYMEFTPAMKPCCSPFTGTQPGLKESE